MPDFLSRLWNSDSLSPHGICLLWRPELVWTHAISDALIGLSYLSISVFLAYLLSRRPDVKFGWVVWCFATFILACGATHFFSIWTLWSPDYGLEAVLKVVTAAASVATALLLWPLLPRALAWPSPEQLAGVNEALRKSLAERDEAFEKLKGETAERLRVEAILHNAQKLDALGQLTGGLAHDYNNLLAVIGMNVSRIEKKLGPDIGSDIRRSLDHVSAATARAAAITQRMLSFARQGPVVATETDVAETITGMVPLLRDGLGDGLDLVLELEPDLPTITLDRNQLENAVLNLVLNARDALPNGGQVKVKARRDQANPDVVMIDVADTGTGMPPEVVERAFDPFFTTKPVGRGSGLGLSQVFGFAKQLGGRVVIDSLLQKGTTVSIALPKGA